MDRYSYDVCKNNLTILKVCYKGIQSFIISSKKQKYEKDMAKFGTIS